MSDLDDFPDPPELIEGVDYRVVEGRWIFTRSYHLRRGYCCESGCLECPYRTTPPEPPSDESVDRFL